MFAVIMAGGTGERLWPCSRNDRPKQFLDLTGRESMLRETSRRIARLVEPEDTYVIATESQARQIGEHLGDIPGKNVIPEPVGRNTAPALGLVALYLERRDPDEIMLALPADHYIDDEDGFVATLSEGAAIARRLDHLGTVGILPTRPETAYGYIERGEEHLEGSPAYPVLRFVEKPDRGRAEQYLSTGRFFWNSGVFIWRVSTFLRLVGVYLPDLAACLDRIRPVLGSPRALATIREEYRDLPAISVDHGVMERARPAFVLPARFGWDDVGDWSALVRLRSPDGEGNVVRGDFVGVDAQGLVVQAETALVAAIGVNDLVIVESDGAILVCAKDRVQDVRSVVAELKRRKLDRYL